MDYSLTFTIGGVTKNTWDDWGMVPSTPPMITPPEVNTRYIDIPGRTNGPIDLTLVPFNKNTYKRMTGSWTFYLEPENKNTRKNMYETLRSFFLGKIGQVKLSEDSAHYFVGRFNVGVPKTSVGPIEFTISYDLEPTRYKTDGTVDTSYASTTGGGYSGDGSGFSYIGGDKLTIEYDSETQDLNISGF